MSGGRRSTAKEQAWRERIAQHARSGLSVREFCLQENLRETAFYNWRRKLARRDEQGHVESTQPTFVPVVVSDVHSQEAPTSDHELVLELAHGRRLKLPPAMPIETLVRLIQVLDEASITEAAR